MRYVAIAFIISQMLISPSNCRADEKPYISTQIPLTLLSANDGETEISWRKTPYGLASRTARTRDSITVIHLSPDAAPVTKTVYGTVPSTIIGTPAMAMSADGRYGMIANHSMRPIGWRYLSYPPDVPMTNDNISADDLLKQELAPPMSNMVSVIDLESPELKVVDRLLFKDQPMHILAHPDKIHYIVGASEHFYVFKMKKGKLVEVSRFFHGFGPPCFWIHPAGNRILATHGDTSKPATVHWYSFQAGNIGHVSEVKVAPGVDTRPLPITAILRIDLDGTKALICQRAGNAFGSLSDVPIADLTTNPPVINSVIKDISDGVENFAFHPNRKMAVATCLGTIDSSLAVLDIRTNPPTVLYYIDSGENPQGLEFTPKGDMLFVGCPMNNRIEVYDVSDDFELHRNPKFMKTGHGHCSLTIGRSYVAPERE